MPHLSTDSSSFEGIFDLLPVETDFYASPDGLSRTNILIDSNVHPFAEEKIEYTIPPSMDISTASTSPSSLSSVESFANEDNGHCECSGQDSFNWIHESLDPTPIAKTAINGWSSSSSNNNNAMDMDMSCASTASAMPRMSDLATCMDRSTMTQALVHDFFQAQITGMGSSSSHSRNSFSSRQSLRQHHNHQRGLSNVAAMPRRPTLTKHSLNRTYHGSNSSSIDVASTRIAFSPAVVTTKSPATIISSQSCHVLRLVLEEQGSKNDPSSHRRGKIDYTSSSLTKSKKTTTNKAKKTKKEMEAFRSTGIRLKDDDRKKRLDAKLALLNGDSSSEETTSTPPITTLLWQQRYGTVAQSA